MWCLPKIAHFGSTFFGAVDNGISKLRRSALTMQASGVIGSPELPDAMLLFSRGIAVCVLLWAGVVPMIIARASAFSARFV